MPHKVKAISKIVEIGNRSLSRLGLPPAHVVTTDVALQERLAVLGQAIDAALNGGVRTDFIERRLADAIEGVGSLLSEAVPSNNISAETVRAWLDWLKRVPAIRDCESAVAKPSSHASPLLKYLHELARIQDQDGIAGAKGALEVDLGAVRQGPLRASNDTQTVVLAFALPPGKKQGARPRILCTTRLVAGLGGEFAGCVGPPAQPELIFSVSEFFDRDGEPLGDYDMAKIANVCAREWLLSQTESWQGFIGEIDQRCIEMFGGPLHEFAQIVFGGYTPNLYAILVDEVR